MPRPIRGPPTSTCPGRVLNLVLLAVLLLVSPDALHATEPMSIIAGVFKFADTTGKATTDTAGVIVATTDINADRRNDIIMLSSDGLQLDGVLLSLKGSPQSSYRLLKLPTKSPKIRSVIPADFNGDGLLDMVYLLSHSSGGPYEAKVAYGTKKDTKIEFEEKEMVAIGNFNGQPLVLQWNDDMIPDLYVETDDGKLTVFIAQTSNKFTNQTISSSKTLKWNKPGYSAYVDMNGDLIADIITFVVDADNNPRFQAILSVNGTFDQNQAFLLAPLPKKAALIGQPIYEDFDMDGNVDMIVPLCEDAECKKSLMYLYHFGDKQWLTVDIQADGMNFLPASLNPLNSLVDLPSLSGMTSTDVDLDSYPDLVLVMQFTDSATLNTTAAILVNQGNGKAFKFYYANGVKGQPLMVNLVDFGDAGVYDITTTQMTANKEYELMTYRQQGIGDAYFLKVMVLSGRCKDSSSCGGHQLPTGIPTPGPAFRYATEAAVGGSVSSFASQTTQTGYLASQLPFHVFGLGPFANYIEKLTVAVPYTNPLIPRIHTFTFIVPKTQLTIIPAPLNDPTKWASQLYIDPFTDMKVIFVAATLLGICVVVGIIIVILQYLEIREDRIEKMQEAQKFNFDAM